MKYVFIGGAPKAGSSALYNMFRKIPEIESSNIKETFYFIDKDYSLQKKDNFYKGGLSGFEKFFNDKTKNIRLEATTHLLYQHDIIKEIKNLDAFFIFVLREPAAKIRSSFEFTLNNLANFSKNISFSEYVDIILSDEKKLLEYEKTKGALEILSRGVYNANYPYFIDRWRAEIPSDRLIVVDYDFFKEDPGKTVSNIIKLINIDVDVKDVVAENKNTTMGIKRKGLHKVMRSINAAVPDFKIKKIIKSLYFKLQQKPIQRSKQDIEALNLLRSKFDFNYKDLCHPSLVIK